MNQEQLAEAVRVQSQTLGRVLIRLEGAGHITRTRQSADRRQFKVELTDSGAAVLEAARRAEINAYPSDPDIGWKVLSEELRKFVNALPADRDQGVVPFAAPEHRTARRAQGGRGTSLRGVDQPRS